MKIIDYRGQCKNFSSRGGSPILLIVNHITASLRDSFIPWFLSPASQSSSHYVVCKNGGTLQFVDCYNKAWTCGNIRNPKSEIVKQMGNKNPNLYTINIEHESLGEPLTEQQYQSTLELHKSILKDFKDIKPDRTHIIGHNEIDSIERAFDPGLNFPWNRLISDLNKEEVVKLDWKQILEKVSTDPSSWEKGITTAVNMAKQDGNLGDLEVFQWLPTLIEKIYNSK